MVERFVDSYQCLFVFFRCFVVRVCFRGAHPFVCVLPFSFVLSPVGLGLFLSCAQVFAPAPSTDAHFAGFIYKFFFFMFHVAHIFSCIL